LGVPEGAEDNGDGTYSVTEDGMVTTYDADGNIVGMEAAEDGTTGDDTGDDGDDGTTTQVLDDGTVVTLDANGDIVSYTDSDGVEYDGDGNEIGDDIIGGGDVGGDGNTTETLDDGTVVTYDADGDIVSYTDTDGVEYDADGEVIDGSDTLVTGDDETEADADNQNVTNSKPTLAKNTQGFNDALDYVKNGGDINKVKAKYLLTKEVEELLNVK
jgi:YD repeat-containing protein